MKILYVHIISMETVWA